MLFRSVAADARSLDAHLNGCPSCRRQHGALATDHGRLRALVAPRPVTDSMRADIIAVAGRPKGRSFAHLLLAAALILLLMAALGVWAGSRPTPVLPGGFAGTWTATNCATHSLGGDRLDFDCDRWGDGSSIALEIGHGEPTSVRVSRGSGAACSGSGTLNTTPPQPADGTFLFIEFSDPSCDVIALGDDHASHLYLEPNDRRIWFDDDGDDWGLFWIRTD